MLNKSYKNKIIILIDQEIMIVFLGWDDNHSPDDSKVIG